MWLDFVEAFFHDGAVYEARVDVGGLRGYDADMPGIARREIISEMVISSNQEDEILRGNVVRSDRDGQALLLASHGGKRDPLARKQPLGEP